MNRRRIVRVQLVLLGLVAVLMVWQTTRGPGIPEGLVTISKLDPGEVTVRTFELDDQTSVLIDAVGSVEDEYRGAPAAYGWILRADSREVVWRQDLTKGERDRTKVATADSVTLAPGRYEVYFATYGPTERSRDGRGPLGLNAHWSNDAKFWHLTVTPQRPVGRRVSFEPDFWDKDTVWSSGAVGNRETKWTRLRVDEPTEIEVYAVAELCVRDCDHAMIVPLGEAEPVWQMSSENTTEAGGLLRNRMFRGPVQLEAGIYEVIFKTDGSHAARSWRANPPYDPIGWGIRIWGNPAQVRQYDPWTGPEPWVAFTEVGNDADLEAVIDVRESVSVVVVATGEAGSGDTVYDYAWLEEGEGVDRIWTMTKDRTEGAGGDRTNRVETAFLDLEPGRYTLHYVSDESHAFDDWRRKEPTVPSRWGVSLFPIEEAQRSRIEVLSQGSRQAPVVDEIDEVGETMGALPLESALLFGASGLGNEEKREGRFTLDEKARVRVVAVGEISDGGRYDYGWIESEGGATVWEMTRRNTQPAGGNDINRIYDGILELDPGTYLVGFKTDFSHSFGDFGGGGPRNPDWWGIRVYTLNQ